MEQESIAAKNASRKRALALREGLSEQEAEKNSRRICEYVLHSPQYAAARSILMYAAIRREVRLKLLAETALQEGKELYFPKVNGNTMEFYRITGPNELTEGAFHVPEPSGQSACWRQPEDNANSRCNLILVPGVAFSKEGQRIGYGKGYYDRYLSLHPELFPVGIAHEIQLVPAWEPEAHDIGVRMLITEKGVKNIDESGRIMPTCT